jgi:hypothetical protein
MDSSVARYASNGVAAAAVVAEEASELDGEGAGEVVSVADAATRTVRTARRVI